MKYRKHFQKLFLIVSGVLWVGIVTAGSSAGAKLESLANADKEKPLQQRVPVGELPQRPALPQPAIDAIPVPAEVRRPPAIYEGERPKELTMPTFEVPVPGSTRKRGRGQPVDELLNFNLGAPAPNSWAGASNTFVSTGFDDNAAITGSVFIPPDSHAAAGPSHVVNVVNVTVSFYTKEGALLFRDSLKNFFNFGAGDARNPLTFTFDPKVIFDQYAQRFVIVALEQTDTSAGDAADTSRLFLAVSDDDNPIGAWYLTVWDSKTTINSTVNWADFPGLAVDDKAVYISANLFGFGASGTFGGNRLWIVDKGLVGGFYDNGTASVASYDPVPSTFFANTQQPAHMFGASPFGTVSGTFLTLFSGLSDGTAELLQVISVDDPLGTAGGPVFTGQFVNIGNIDNLAAGGLADAPQLGSATAIDVNDRRTLNAVWRNNALWITTTIAPNSGADAGQTTAYWVKLNTSGSAISVADQGAVGGEDIAAGTFTFFPSITVNENGDAAIGFSASAPTIYPGAYFVTREAGDAAGSTGASQTVKAGVDSYVRTFGGSRNRWGDYSGAAVDPANGCLWLYNEWADVRSTVMNGGDGRWGTAYAKTCACAPTSKAVAQNQWTMFSLACALGQEGQYNTVADLFPKLDINAYGDPDTGAGSWVVFKRDAANDVYIEKAFSDALQEGVGYWFKTSLSGVSIRNEGMKLSGADIPLQAVAGGRLNLVGYPRAASLPWANVKIWNGSSELSLDQADPVVAGGKLACDVRPPDSSCTVSRKMYQWNGSTSAYQVYDGQTPGMQGTLQPLDALWVEAFKSGTALRFPTTLAAAPISAPGPVSLHSSAAVSQNVITTEYHGRYRSRRAQRSKAFRKKSKRRFTAWSVRLIASSGALEDPGNMLGQLADSRVGQDIHDLREPEPFDSPYLSIVFPHQKWESYDWGYTSDFHGLSRRPKGRWKFSVKASAGVSPVTLRWRGERSILRKARLVDLFTGKKIKLSRHDSYTFVMNGSERSFRFVVR